MDTKDDQMEPLGKEKNGKTPEKKVDEPVYKQKFGNGHWGD